MHDGWTPGLNTERERLMRRMECIESSSGARTHDEVEGCLTDGQSRARK